MHRPYLLLTPVVLLACAVASSGTASGGQNREVARCQPVPPSHAQPFAFEQAEVLAGDYDLVLIDTTAAGTPRADHSRLHLYVTDSTYRNAVDRRYRPGVGATRPVAGWLEASRLSPRWRAIVGSRDPLYPGVVLRRDYLRIGQTDVLDGQGDNLVVTRVASEGFWGTWRRDNGLVVVLDTTTGREVPAGAGYFCALRAPGA